MLVALVLRIAACWLWADDLSRDRDAYLGIARNIYAGNGFCTPETATPTAFRPPVYPILIGIVRLALPESVTVAVVNIAAGLATVWAAWMLVGIWWQAPIWQRVIASLAIAIDPLLLRYTAQPMTECVFTALTAWTLVGLTHIFRTGKAPLITGLFAGSAILCRPTLLPFVGLMMIVLFGLAASKRFVSWRASVLFAAGWVVLIGVWAGRNQIVMGHPILTTTHGGYTLLLGNNPVFYEEVVRKPWGTVWSHDSLLAWQTSLAVQMQNDLGDHVDEVAADEWHVRQATHAMHDDPEGFHAAVWYRIRSFWSLTPRGPERTAGLLLIVVAVWYSALFLLAAIGFINALLRRHPAAFLGGLLIATVAALHLIYWTDTRMRAPLHPILVAVAAGCLWKNPTRGISAL